MLHIYIYNFPFRGNIKFVTLLHFIPTEFVILLISIQNMYVLLKVKEKIVTDNMST